MKTLVQALIYLKKTCYLQLQPVILIYRKIHFVLRYRFHRLLISTFMKFCFQSLILVTDGRVRSITAQLILIVNMVWFLKILLRRRNVVH